MRSRSQTNTLNGRSEKQQKLVGFSTCWISDLLKYTFFTIKSLICDDLTNGSKGLLVWFFTAYFVFFHFCMSWIGILSWRLARVASTCVLQYFGSIAVLYDWYFGVERTAPKPDFSQWNRVLLRVCTWGTIFQIVVFYNVFSHVCMSWHSVLSTLSNTKTKNLSSTFAVSQRLMLRVPNLLQLSVPIPAKCSFAQPSAPQVAASYLEGL